MKKIVLILALLNFVCVAQSFAMSSEKMAQANAFINQLQSAETSANIYREYRGNLVAGQKMPSWFKQALQSVLGSENSLPYAKSYASDMLNILTGSACANALNFSESITKSGKKGQAHYMDPITPRNGSRVQNPYYMGPSRADEAQSAPHFDSGGSDVSF